MYVVDGVERTLPGVYRVPGDGLLVEESAVPRFQQIASRAEGYERHNRELLRERDDLLRLTEWPSKGSDGTSVTLKGREAIEGMRVTLARQGASLEAMAGLFQLDPVDVLVQDEQGNVHWNMAAVQNTVVREARLAEREKMLDARASFAKMAQPAPAQPQAPAAPPIDFAKDGPPFIKAQASALQLPANALTPQDEAYLVGLLPRYMRPATEADRQTDYQISVGQPVVDASFAAIVKDRAELRAAAVRAATKGEEAGRFNAGMDAGKSGQKGKTPVVSPKTPSITPQGRGAPTQRTAPSGNDLWQKLTEEAVASVGG